MGKCTRCGEKAGFMMSLCGPCIEAINTETLERAQKAAALSPPPAPPGKRPMVSGAKFGLVALCLYFVCFGFGIYCGESGHDDVSEFLGFMVMYPLPILIAAAGFITGTQKRRPVIALLALFTSSALTVLRLIAGSDHPHVGLLEPILIPIGLFFALGAENKAAQDS